jgi:hypothetical protein
MAGVSATQIGTDWAAPSGFVGQTTPRTRKDAAGGRRQAAGGRRQAAGGRRQAAGYLSVHADASRNPDKISRLGWSAAVRMARPRSGLGDGPPAATGWGVCSQPCGVTAVRLSSPQMLQALRYIDDTSRPPSRQEPRPGIYEGGAHAAAAGQKMPALLAPAPGNLAWPGAACLPCPAQATRGGGGA